MRLAALGRVQEERAGAVRMADALLRTSGRPWCPDMFSVLLPSVTADSDDMSVVRLFSCGCAGGLQLWLCSVCSVVPSVQLWLCSVCSVVPSVQLWLCRRRRVPAAAPRWLLHRPGSRLPSGRKHGPCTPTVTLVANTSKV
ncbi:hypothetical protein GCM10009564_47430 [Streptomyces thermogriseus]|uniref:Uncharacterized protein n=1 Tax=Streptomyces thermogriseus TaxID=75292 RepID=A0ABN1T551_9ACTN